MKIILSERANMSNGGYSWIMSGELTQTDVTGLVLDAYYYNSSDESKEMTVKGQLVTLAPKEALVTRESLEAAGFIAFSVLAVYSFFAEEFAILED